MTAREISIFEKLLFADTFRGPHSTGVFARRTTTINKKEHVSIPLYKKAVEGPEFLETAGWIDVAHGFTKASKLPNFIVGHNRWATMGKINDVNAHPFKVGEITLVHNGTLIDQTLLPDYLHFDVDSENVAHSINKIGAKETIQKLDGAFTLIWHDAKDDTLHIIRNEERPFHIAHNSSGDWFGASEEAMLMWILERGKLPYTVKNHFECKVGVEYVFNVNNTFTLQEEIIHKLPDFPKDYYETLYGGSYGNGYGMGDMYSDYYSNSSAPLPVKTKKKTPCVINVRKVEKVNHVLKNEGVIERMGDKMVFTAYTFHEYVANNKNTSGRVVGYLDDHVDYVEVQMHNVERLDFKKHEDLIGIVVGAYTVGGVTTVILRQMVFHEQEGNGSNVVDFPSQEDEAEEVRIADGRSYTKKQWDDCQNSQCGNCSDEIPFNQIDKSDTEWIGGTPVCSKCIDIVNYVLDANEKEPKQDEHTFCCKNCGQTVGISQESEVYDICTNCHTWLMGEIDAEKNLKN